MVEMGQVVQFAPVYRQDEVGAALSAAAEAARLAEDELASIARHRQRTTDSGRIVTPFVEGTPVPDDWKEVGR